MPMMYIATEETGNITAASTTDPTTITYAENDVIPNFQHGFDLTWEQIDQLWKYKVVDGNLVLKEG